MERSIEIELKETIITGERCVDKTTTFEYDLEEMPVAEASISKESTTKGNGRKKSKEGLDKIEELKTMMDGGLIRPLVTQKEIFTNNTNTPSTSEFQTNSMDWVYGNGKGFSGIEVGKRGQRLDEKKNSAIQRLLACQQQQMVYNQLLVAKLPCYDEINDFRSTLDVLCNLGYHYYAWNWKPGFRTKPPQRGFATRAFMMAEEEYLKRFDQRRSNKQSWTEEIKREKIKLGDGLGILKSINPASWRNHGKKLKPGQKAPESSCKIQVETKCGHIVYRWYVKCHREKTFFRTVHDASICGIEKCDEYPTWKHGDRPLEHKSSRLEPWVEVDPDEIDPRAKLRTPIGSYYEEGGKTDDELQKAPENRFPVWMLSWLEKGPPEEKISDCMKVSIITKCGQVNARLLILCDKHIQGEEHCAGDREHLIILDYACSLGKDKNRCEVRHWCECYIKYWKDLLQDSTLVIEERRHITSLISLLTEEYSNAKESMPFLRHSQSVPVVKGVWVGWMNNTLDYYEMLSRYGLAAISPLTHL